MGWHFQRDRRDNSHKEWDVHGLVQAAARIVIDGGQKGLDDQEQGPGIGDIDVTGKISGRTWFNKVNYL